MRRLWIFATGFALACQRAPSTPTTPAPSVAAGQVVSDLLLGSTGEYTDPELARYVGRVAARIARAAGSRKDTFELRVSDDFEPSADALPGGVLVISRGALAALESEAELAAVIAHEMAHSLAGHPEPERHGVPARVDSRDVGAFALDADEERQADALAVRYLGAAGYDPKALASALDALGRGAQHLCRRRHSAAECSQGDGEPDPHPEPAARRARILLLAGTTSGELGRARYLASIDGLPLGERSAKLSGRRFESADGLVIELPPEWTPTLSGHVLSAKGPDGELVILRLHGRALRAALLREVTLRPFDRRVIAGRKAVVGSLTREPGNAAAVLDSGAFVHVLWTSGHDARALLLALLRRVRAVAPARTPIELGLTRLRERASPGARLPRACGDADPELARALNDPRWIQPGAFVKCVRASK